MDILKKLFTAAVLSLVFCAAEGQVLVKTYTLSPGEASAFCADKGIEYANKPNGVIYRLREEVTYPDLPRTPEVEDKILIITDKIDKGYLALFRNPLGADEYSFYAVTYDRKRKVTGVYDLCELSDNRYCEVQDIRWFDDHLYFNMACPSYSSGVGGRGSKLYSLNLKTGRIEWSTRYLTSNDVFTVDKNYVYCGYGFTDEPDFVYLIDRRYGITLTECPIWTAPQYMELIGPGKLYVQDYNDWGYIFKVEPSGVKVTGEGVRLRTGPTTSSAFLKNEDGSTLAPLKGDVLPCWGQEGDFNKVIYDGEYVYISRLYSTTEVMPRYDSCERLWAGVRAWLGAEDDVIHFEIFDMEKFCSATGVDMSEVAIEPGVFDVTIDSPLACGVYIDRCLSNLGLYVMSEDCRVFGVNLTAVARGRGVVAEEFGKDVLGENFPVVDLISGKTEDGEGEAYPTVWAVDPDGLRSRFDLRFGEIEPMDADVDPLSALQTKFDIYGALVDSEGKSTNMEISFETSYSGQAAGTITYRPGGRTSVIRLLGKIERNWESPGDERYTVTLREFLDDGLACGLLTLTVTRDLVLGGLWRMDGRELFLIIDDQECVGLPDGPALLKKQPAEAAGGSWGWTFKTSGSGQVTYTYTGEAVVERISDTSIRFSVMTVMPNIASVEGVAKRDGFGRYVYTDEEGHDICSLLLYPEGIYVTLLDESYSDNFGMGASIDGWYPKIKE